MSVYHKDITIGFINANKINLINLKKFAHLSADSNCESFIDAMKITKHDAKKLINVFGTRDYEPGKLKVMTAQHVKNKIKGQPEVAFPKNVYQDIYNELIINNNVLQRSTYYNKFFEFNWNTNETKRLGTMSYVSCDNFMKDYELFNMLPIDQSNYSLNISTLPNYFGKRFDYFGRFIFFENRYSTSIINCSSKDYSKRYKFRYYFTTLILGDDYIFNFKHGVFPDGTLGQEVIYYLFEIYNYDRYHFINHAFNVNTYVKYNGNLSNLMKNMNDIYPPLDGVYYFDHQKLNNMDVSGNELVIFIPDISLTLTKIIYIKKKPNNNELELVKKNTVADYIVELQNFINNYDILSTVRVAYDNAAFVTMNNKLLEQCVGG
jgi:hypothetical protein